METAAQIDALFAREVVRIEQPEVLALVKQLRVPTRKEDRPWNYGSEGQTVPCWIVLEHRKADVAIAYCSHGFADPWGLLNLTGDTSMGMDSEWFVSLEDAVRGSRAWDGKDPAGYEVG